MKRVAAIATAVCMVAVAVFVRSALDDDGGGDDPQTDGAVVVVCATDLEDACEALGSSVEVRVEDPADTAAALADGTIADDVDAWVTSTAWDEVVTSRAPGSLGDGTQIVATSPATVAADPDRVDAITNLCADDDIWHCLGSNVGRDWADLGGSATWGELEVGLPDADLAFGLPVIASATAGYFGSRDFAANELAQSEFQAWLADLTAPSGTGESDPALTMATRQGSYSAAGDVASVVEQLAGRGVQAVDPEVPIAATVAVVALRGSDGLPASDIDEMRRALADDGWSTAFNPEDIPTLKPGVMAALHSLWKELIS